MTSDGFIRQVRLELPETDGETRLMFLKYRVKRPSVEKAERRFMALLCKGTSFDDKVEYFLDWCREQFPGGRTSCRGMFHGPLRYIAPDGTEVLFCGIVASPANGMEEA